MKHFIFLNFGLLMFLNLQCQAMADSSIYNKGLRMIADAKTVQEYENAANYFNAISSDKPHQWLAPLYAGLSYILASFKETGDKQLKDKLCDKAQVCIDSSALRNADISEVAALQAFLYQARIDVSPTERGLDYSLKADTEIKKAEAANPMNPRPYFLYGMNEYYTPRIFGGGAEKALPLFEQAAEKFEVFVPEMPFMPNWGKQQNLDMIAKCKAADDK
jgi:hypothetical protein